MHPLLALENLEKLPPSHRVLAQAALSGSEEDIDALKESIDSLPKTDIVHTLPVVYALLGDSVHNEKDALQRFPVVQAALDLFLFVSVSGRGIVPSGVIPDLWPRLWSCFECIHEHLPESSAELKLELADMLIYAAALMLRDGKIEASVVLSTPGFYKVVGAAWATSFSPDPDATVAPHHAKLLQIVVTGAASSEQAFNDFVAGAGGSQDSLAALILQRMADHLPAPQAALDEEHIVGLGSLLGFFEMEGRPLRAPLVKSGSVDRIVSTCAVLLRNFLPTSSNPLRHMSEASFRHVILAYLNALWEHLIYPRYQERIVEALQAGLLPMLLTYAEAYDPSGPDKAISGRLMQILRILPPSTVYLSVLVQLGPSLIDAGSLHSGAHADFAEEWKTLVEIVEKRIVVVQEFETGKLPKYRACDNLQCGALRELGKIQRCSGCLSANYCNAECQSADYTSGQHRKHCKQLRVAHDSLVADISPSDLEFLRALVNHTYSDSATLGAIALNTAMGLEYTTFDFTRGACAVNNAPLRALANDTELIDQLKLELVRRTAGGIKESSGRARLDMHLVAIRGRTIFAPGPGAEARAVAVRWIAMPLRSSNTAFREESRRIAEDVYPRAANRETVKSEWILEQLEAVDVIQTH
ncbi:MYND-type domain-containing protein [Mycena kentingensis (nom. inval.)]|nr:MYND-type domain-containing protein [Mycena kentingensis (nom. inval.)]